MNFKEVLKRDLLDFIHKNEEYNQLSQRLQELREEKQEKEEKVITLLKNAHVDSKVFLVNDYKVTQKTYYQYQTLSMKYLETCLRGYCEENDIMLNVKDCLDFIKKKRDKKEKFELKMG